MRPVDNALEEALRVWGAAKRKILGIPPQPRSIFGRIHDEGAVGAAIRGQAPDPPEVMLHTALLVGRALRTALDDHTMPYHCHEVLTAHYVYRGPPSVKAIRLGVTPRVYYSRLDQARTILKPYLSALEAQEQTDA